MSECDLFWAEMDAPDVEENWSFVALLFAVLAVSPRALERVATILTAVCGTSSSRRDICDLVPRL